MKITDKFIFFWGEELSNFHSCSIKYNYGGKDMNFTSSEQMFMWLKAKAFNDNDIAEQILLSNTPKEAKRLGRKVKNFDEEIWVEKRENAMMLALRYKFSEQNPNLFNFIMDKRFDNKEFVEASPFDKIWGIGLSENDDMIHNKKNWKGLNLLGKCLNKIRKEIK